MKSTVKVLSVLLLASLFFGCPNPDPTDTPDIVAGTWSGDWDETYVGMGTFTATVTLVRNGSTLTGTAVTPVNGFVYDIVGSITGSTVAGTLTYTVINTYQITVNGSVSGDTMTGTWVDNDTPPWGGNFVMTRQ